jgi:hypothetical protein
LTGTRKEEKREYYTHFLPGSKFERSVWGGAQLVDEKSNYFFKVDI